MNSDKFYITTAIPYVNADLHIGNTMDFIFADVLARYHRGGGDKVRFVVGTDEYGAKIAEAAAKAGLEPQAFTDQMSGRIVEIHQKLNIQYDQFVRTTSAEHKQAAQEIWKRLAKDIYKAQYKGWYCVGCEAYVSENEAKANNYICPDHKTSYEMIEEENYFFALSKYTQQIKQAIINDEYRVVPVTRKHEILAVLEEGLQDVSFSRPKSKLAWGVEVPGDPDHVMYVWCDALTNYLTGTGFPEAGFEEWWPADLHVIGKGILRFHAAIWPGMLLAAGLPLPKNLFVHGYITVDGQKISKTIGNVVDPRQAVEKYGADAVRYYLLRAVPSDGDGDFSWDRFIAVYNSELANDLGNLVSRVSAMITKYQNGVIGGKAPATHDEGPYHAAIAEYRFDRALEEVWVLVKDLNLYVEQEKPWILAKEDPEHLKEVLLYLASNILQVALLLSPFIPETASKIAAVFKGEELKPLKSSLFPKIETETNTT